MKEENKEETPVEINQDETKKEEVLEKAKKIDAKTKKKKKPILVIFIILLLLGVIGYGVYSYLQKEKPKSIKTSKTKVESKYTMNGNDLQDFDLYFLQIENAKTNKIYSPLSIKYALEMLSEGASGETKEQIDAVIGKYESKKYTNSANMSLANAMFIKDSMKDSINESYINNLKDKYNAEVIYDPFTSATNANNWISEKTFKLINNLLTDETVAPLDFMLINALAIDMEWNYKIQWEANESKVENKNYRVNFKHEKYTDYVPMIENKSEFSTIDFNNGSSKVKAAQIGATINNYDIIKELGEDNIRKEIEAKYREYLKDPHCGEETSEEAIKKYVDSYISDISENYKFVDYSTDFEFYTDDTVKVFAKDLKTYDNTTLQYIGIMPIAVDLETYIKDASAKSINILLGKIKPLVLDSFEYGKVYKIKGFIPFFSYEYELKLMDDLKSLGIKDVFEHSKADLSKMTGVSGEAIEEAIHKSNIKFTNDGIKASAATVMGGMGSAACDSFDYLYDVPVEEIDLTFDKPYMYLIRDKATGEVWFTGTVYEPSTTY